MSYTTLSIEKIQKIKNPEALAVYCYLCSLPPQQLICKERIKKHFRIGNKKINDIVSYLVSEKLITMDLRTFID